MLCAVWEGRATGDGREAERGFHIPAGMVGEGDAVGDEVPVGVDELDSLIVGMELAGGDKEEEDEEVLVEEIVLEGVGEEVDVLDPEGVRVCVGLPVDVKEGVAEVVCDTVDVGEADSDKVPEAVEESDRLREEEGVPVGEVDGLRVIETVEDEVLLIELVMEEEGVGLAELLQNARASKSPSQQLTL